MALFLSTYINKIDKKGRVSVPAPFRAALAGESFQGIIAFRSYKYQAIEACNMSRMEQLSSSVDRLDFFSDAQDDLTASIFADAQQLPLDGDGRVSIPAILQEHAGLTDSIAFVGRGTTFQLWKPEAFEAHQAAARQRVQAQQTTISMQPATPSFNPKQEG